MRPARRRGERATRVWEETLAWAGKDLFVSVTGEEKDGRYTITEARLFRVNAEDMALVPAAPDQEGYLKQQVPLADGSLLVTANVSTRMRVSRLEPGSGEESGRFSSSAAGSPTSRLRGMAE